MTSQSHPTQVELHSATHVLSMTWSDGTQTDFALKYLRGWCPCATCQGHFVLHKKFIDANATLMNVEPVGAYGMRLTWLDGHSTGIYSFNYLREIYETPPGEGITNREMLLNG